MGILPDLRDLLLQKKRGGSHSQIPNAEKILTHTGSRKSGGGNGSSTLDFVPRPQRPVGHREITPEYSNIVRRLALVSFLYHFCIISTSRPEITPGLSFFMKISSDFIGVKKTLHLA